MTGTISVLHVRDRAPLDVEQALVAIFKNEGRESRMRLEGVYSAVLARLLEPSLDARYRYLLCRPHAASRWTPVLELGNRTDGLDVELSARLGSCDVVTTFVFGDVFSGYRVARAGALLDRYTSDPTYSDVEADAEPGDESAAPPLATQSATAQLAGPPELFADLFPTGTTPEEFARVVLRPGYWERLDESLQESGETAEEDDYVDEVDRMRCIALALELWGPEEYPFSRDLDSIPSAVVGPVIALAFA